MKALATLKAIPGAMGLAFLASACATAPSPPDPPMPCGCLPPREEPVPAKPQALSAPPVVNA